VLTQSESFNDHNEIDKVEEDYIELFESGEDAAEAFQPAKKPFHFIAFLVEFAIIFPGTSRLDLGGTTGIMPRSGTNCRVSSRAGCLASATITRRLTSITKAHQAAGCNDSPASSRHFVVSETLKGIRRAIGTGQHGQDPLLTLVAISTYTAPIEAQEGRAAPMQGCPCC